MVMYLDVIQIAINPKCANLLCSVSMTGVRACSVGYLHVQPHRLSAIRFHGSKRARPVKELRHGQRLGDVDTCSPSQSPREGLCEQIYLQAVTSGERLGTCM
jgi:hypothetical protein